MTKKPVRYLSPMIISLTITTGLAVATSDAAELQSGLQQGDTAVAFHVEDVTGPRKGNELCYACAFGKHPVVNIQATRLSRALVQFIKQLDSLVDPAASIKGDSVHAFVVLLTEDPDVAIEDLKAAAATHQIKNIPLTIYDELTGPPPYKISTDAEVTVMMWNQTKVASNHAFAPGQFDQDAATELVRKAKGHLGR